MLTQSDLIFNQELAAWVQAVGSVFAIFVAISIPLYLNHLAQKRDSNALELQKSKFFVTLLPTLYRIRRYSTDFLQQMANHADSTENILHHLESEYLELIPVFSNELQIFTIFANHSIKSIRELFYKFHTVCKFCGFHDLFI